jgi:peptide/nickel transport system substrate-binding protein
MSLGLVVPTVSGAAAPRGVLRIAEAPNATPNYILPFYPPSQCTVTNTSQFQQMMFRPLYWFGLGTNAGLIPNISAGNAPKYTHNNTRVTFTTKGWKFADGQTVNGQSVMFFLNMFKAEPSNFCTYTPGLGIPDQVAGASAHGNSVTIILKSSVNPLWFTDNMLAVITPMANAWDRTASSTNGKCASGAYGAASTIVNCKNVYNYLNAQALKVNTFTGKMWQSGVDGPWLLTKMDNLGNATFVANSKYSGPVKPKIKTVKLIAFTTAQAEENQLQAGNIDLGYVDASVLTSPATSPTHPGANWGPVASKYNLVSGELFSNNYMNLNFGNNPGAKFMNQTYIRQALEQSINQAAIIKNAFKGYGVPTYSALPPLTPLSESAPIKNPFPFSLSAAESLLTSHGWTMQSGQLVCTSPGTGASNCGAGIASGDKLSLSVLWVSGTPSLDTEMNAILADWSTLGISTTHATDTFGHVAGACPIAYNKASTYDICNWGGGWLFAPDYFPSGEPLYLTGAGSNSGGYSNATMDTLIKQTLSANVKLTAYGNFSAKDVPVLWDPLATGTGEVSKKLHSNIGFTSVLDNFTPEYYHF